MNQRSTWSLCLILAMSESAMALPPRPLAPRPPNKLAQPGMQTPIHRLPSNGAHLGMASQTAVSPGRQSTLINPCPSSPGLALPSAAASAPPFKKRDCPNASHSGLSRLGGAIPGRPFEAPALGVSKPSWTLDDKPPKAKSTLSDLAFKGAQPAEPKLP